GIERTIALPSRGRLDAELLLLAAVVGDDDDRSLRCRGKQSRQPQQRGAANHCFTCFASITSHLRPILTPFFLPSIADFWAACASSVRLTDGRALVQWYWFDLASGARLRRHQSMLINCQHHGPSYYCYIQKDDCHLDASHCTCGARYSPECPVDVHREASASEKPTRFWAGRRRGVQHSSSVA